MKKNFFGGVAVKKFELECQKEILGSGPYEYFIYSTEEAEELNFKYLRSYSVYVYYKAPKASIISLGLKKEICEGDCIQVEDVQDCLKISGGIVKLLISGTTYQHPNLKGLFFTKHADIYRVEKPWGHELWINGQHPCYALKKIFIKTGTKTSLQYHNFKQETNVLFQGIAKLHYKKNLLVENDLVTSADIGTTVLEPNSVADVSPLTLHRLEAMTDILLFETSTPHLDDVVRVQDDSKRSHGRLVEEHMKT